MKPTLKKSIPRTVWFLGLVSLFTDFSSEMIYPLLPVFLSTTLGATALELGIIEGVAETTASLLKLFSGIWTDRLRRRKPLVLGGYALASCVRPLIGLAQAWPTVLGLRFLDRVGKGLRSSPRDALIADVTPSAQRGAAYGFHRSMDHAGAVIGPLAATLLLSVAGVSIRHIFLFAALPGAVAVLILVFFVHDPARKPEELSEPALERRPSFNPFRDWSPLNKEFKIFLLALLLFTLGNSTDAFLLVRLSQAGVAARWIPGLWAAHHVVKMVTSFYGGRWADRLRPKTLIISGWFFYALIYFAFSRTGAPAALIGIFLAYGIYYGLTEPAERAWVSQLVKPEVRGSAFGFYHFMMGLGALPASLFFGWIWKTWGVPAAFLTGAALAGAAALILMFVPTPGEGPRGKPLPKALLKNPLNHLLPRQD